MNGRVYDPSIGRFQVADPHIQAPLNTQSYNRYSYVLNNPLKYTDPSGYFFKKIKKAFKKIGKFIKKYARTIVAAAIAYYTGGLLNPTTFWGHVAQGALGGAAFGASNVILHGGDFQQALQAGLQGAISGAITGGIKGNFGNTWNLKRVAVSSIGGGISARISGGKFRDGFKMAALTSSMRYIYNKHVKYDVDGRAKKGAIWKAKDDMSPSEHHNDWGRSHYTDDPLKIGKLVSVEDIAKHEKSFVEGGFFSKIANAIPGLNTTSDIHDTWVQWMGGEQASALQNWGTMLPAYVVSTGATMDRYGIGNQLVVNKSK